MQNLTHYRIFWKILLFLEEFIISDFLTRIVLNSLFLQLSPPSLAFTNPKSH